MKVVNDHWTTKNGELCWMWLSNDHHCVARYLPDTGRWWGAVAKPGHPELVPVVINTAEEFKEVISDFALRFPNTLGGHLFESDLG